MKRVALKLVLIFVLVFAGVKMWYGRLEERLQIPAAPPQPEAAGRQPAGSREILPKSRDYTIIVARNIFQAVVDESEKQVTEPPPKELEQTKLKLSLMGTVSGSDRDARAIITDDTKRQQDIYQIGDTIQGALIEDIQRGRVILEVNGVDEVLTLADRQGGGPAYEPSQADFYQEPVEQPLPQEPEPEQQEVREIPQQREPVVRPRPFRRPRIQSSPPSRAMERPGADRTGMPGADGAEETNMQENEGGSAYFSGGR